MTKHSHFTRIAKRTVGVLTLAMALSFAMVASAFAESGFDAAAAVSKTVGSIEAAANGQPVLQSEDFEAGESISDWTAIDLALAGRAEADGGAAYLKALEDYVTKRYATEDKLDGFKSTEWHRIALVVKALGGDPCSFGTGPDGKPINLIADGVYNWKQSKDLGDQGLNAYIHALITLDASGAEVPKDAKYSRQKLVDALISAQGKDGGWGLTPSSPDVDITAMTLQALAPYKDGQARDAVAKGVAWLSKQQRADGGFESGKTPNSESCAQVIIGLCACGIDPTQAAEFDKAGQNPVTALMGFALDDGSFAHEKNSESDAMATEQALMALLALAKYQQGGGPLMQPSASGSLVVITATDAPAAPAAPASSQAAGSDSAGISPMTIAIAAIVVIALVAGIALGVARARKEP